MDPAWITAIAAIAVSLLAALSSIAVALIQAHSLEQRYYHRRGDDEIEEDVRETARETREANQEQREINQEKREQRRESREIREMGGDDGTQTGAL